MILALKIIEQGMQGAKMSNFVIFNSIEQINSVVKKNKIEYSMLSDDLKEIAFVCYENNSRFEFELKRQIQPKEQVFFLKNIVKAIDSGFVDFTDNKLYDFSFENNRAKDAGGANSKFIDSDLKAEYKKEFDLYYQKMLNLIIANNDLKFAEFMYKMSDFFANVLSESEFNETPFELREKFYDYLTDKFTL